MVVRSARVSGYVLLAILLSLAACARDITSPRASRAGPRASVRATRPRYIVLFRAEAIPADLSTRVAALGGRVAYAHPAGIALGDGLDAAGAATLSSGADVAEVEPDFTVSLDPHTTSVPVRARSVSGQAQANPAGALLFPWQWNMRDVKADVAWAAGKLGSPTVTVAILDTGLDYNIIDLDGLVDLSRSASFVPSDDSVTVHFFPRRNLVTDYNGHGTNVAQQVASKAIVFAGVTSRTELIGVKVLGANGVGTLGGVLEGVLWAADHGADVANLSLGADFPRAGNGEAISMIKRAFSYARDQGVLVVVAAGNSSMDLDPDANFHAYCSLASVVCVSAVGPTTPAGNPDLFAFYSNFGQATIDVAGPGGNGAGIVSSWPWGNDSFSWVWSMCSKTLLAGFQPDGTPILAGCQSGNFILGFIGTSQATPHASGVAALIVAKIGRGKPGQVKLMLEQTADQVSPFTLDQFTGHGRVDAARASM